MDIMNQQYLSNTSKPIYNNSSSASVSNQPTAGTTKTSSDGTVTISLRNASAGDIFHGEITNISGKNVTISLGDSQILNALLGEKVPLAVGNQLYFEVKENRDDKIMIRPLTDEKYSALSQTAAKALEADGLQQSHKNINLVKSMIDYNMAVDRNSVLSMLKNTTQFPNTELNTMLSLKAAGLPINQQTIAGFQSFEQGTYQLNDKMNTLVNDVISVFQEYSQSATPNLLAFNGELLSLQSTDKTPIPQILLSDAFSNIEESLVTMNEKTVSQNEDTPLTSVQEETNSLKGTSEAVVLESIPKDGTKSALINESIIQETPLENGNTETQKQEQSMFLEGLTKGLEKLGISKDDVQNMINDAKTLQDVMKNIHKAISESTVTDKEEINKFLSSKEYTSMVKEFLQTQWALTPAQMKDKGQLDQFFDRMLSQNQQIEQSMKQLDLGSGGFSQHSQDTKDSVDYMQQINNMYSYAQIPVKFSNGTVNSELFVYTNKKSIGKKSNDLSVLLHLDMKHLGPTDVKVQLKGGAIHSRFYLNDDVSCQLIGEHIQELNQKIKELGFDFTTEIVDREDKGEEVVTDFNKDFLLKDKPVGNVNKRVEFDVKA